MDSMVVSLKSFASPVLLSMAGNNPAANSYYNNNYTYNIQPGGESTAAQLAAIRNENTLNEMRGKG